MHNIRNEKPSDRASVCKLIASAFKGKPYAQGDEQDLLDKLEKANALVLSLVAIEDNTVIGQVAFSPAQNSNNSGTWYALGPVAVTPARQGEGIGARLIETGLAELKQKGASGCILVGDPAYYSRFGFELTPGCCPEGEPEAYFMVKSFSDQMPIGKFSFHPAFY